MIAKPIALSPLFFKRNQFSHTLLLFCVKCKPTIFLAGAFLQSGNVAHFNSARSCMKRRIVAAWRGLVQECNVCYINNLKAGIQKKL